MEKQKIWKPTRMSKKSGLTYSDSDFLGTKSETTFETLSLWRKCECCCFMNSKKECIKHDYIWGICSTEGQCFALDPSLLNRQL